MKFEELKIILKRLYKDHVNRYLNRIFLSLFLSLIVSLSTSAIAWLLDPAVKKIFIENDPTYAWTIPLAIIIAFSSSRRGRGCRDTEGGGRHAAGGCEDGLAQDARDRRAKGTAGSGSR